MELLESVSDFPVWKLMIVPRESCLCDDIHPELPHIGTVGMGSNSLGPTGVALVAVAVVLRHLWWLRIGNLLNESGADALRLVEVIATLRTAVIVDLDFLIWIGRVAPFWVMTGLSARRDTVSTWLLVVLVLESAVACINLVGMFIFSDELV
jgi:hypothetical protein